MALVPLTAAQVDGAFDDSEIRALNISGENTGMILFYKRGDAALLAAQDAGQILVDGPRLVAAPTHNDQDFPNIVGNMVQGETVTADPQPSAWTGNPTFTYEWVRNGSVIPGATGPSYTLTAGEVGMSMEVNAIGTNSGGSLKVGGNTRGPVTAAP